MSSTSSRTIDAQLGGVQLDLQVDDDLLDDLGDLVAQLLRPERRGDRDVDALHQQRHHLRLHLQLALVLAPRARLGRRPRPAGRASGSAAARRRAPAGAARGALGVQRVDDVAQELALLGQRRLGLARRRPALEHVVRHLGELHRARLRQARRPSAWRTPLGRGRAQHRQRVVAGGEPAGVEPVLHGGYFLLQPALEEAAGRLDLLRHAGELDAEPVQVGDHLVLGIGGDQRLALEARLGHAPWGRAGRRSAACASMPASNSLTVTSGLAATWLAITWTLACRLRDRHQLHQPVGSPAATAASARRR